MAMTATEAMLQQAVMARAMERMKNNVDAILQRYLHTAHPIPSIFSFKANVVRRIDGDLGYQSAISERSGLLSITDEYYYCSIFISQSIEPWLKSNCSGRTRIDGTLINFEDETDATLFYIRFR